MNNKKIIIPLPAYGFDPTEAAIPWKLLSGKGVEVCFATPAGEKAAADKIMLTGKGLGIWKGLLQAGKDAVNAYHEMENSIAFCHPFSYAEIKETGFDGLLLPGGHDKGVKEYLESKILQQLVVSFFKAQKPVAAICHGVVLAARSMDAETKRSVLYSYKTTALLQSQELAAYNLTRLWLKDYYLTYPGLTVQREVTAALQHRSQFIKGPMPFSRDDLNHLSRGFTVRDRHYISARWPGDVYGFALKFAEMLSEPGFTGLKN